MKPERATTNSSHKTYPYRKFSDNHKYYVSKSHYNKIVRAVNESMLEYCLETGMEGYLPFALGSFQVLKFKPVDLALDVGHMMKTGERRYHENLHTDGFAVEFRWNKNRSYGFRGKYSWIFNLTRSKNRYEYNSLVKFVRRNGVDKYFQR